MGASGAATRPVGKKEEPTGNEPVWDAKAFKDCRPLQCQSIWDMPTSRIPNPTPVLPEELEMLEGKAKKKKKKKAVLPTVECKVYQARSVDGPSAATRPPPRRCGRRSLQALVLALVVVVVVVVLAKH